MFERYKALFDRFADERRGAAPALAFAGPARVCADMPPRPAPEARTIVATTGAGGGRRRPPAVADDDPDLLGLDDWQALKPAWRGHQGAARERRAQAGAVGRATDALRTQLLQAMKAEGACRLAVSAPTSGCGTTFTAVNLALSLAAVPDVRTVLLDLNQRRPGIGGALDNPSGLRMADLLSDRVSPMAYLQRYGDNLAVGFNAEAAPNPAELLQSQSAADMLDEITGLLTPDVILCDMPPLLEYDDVLAFLPQVDGVLLVADATRTEAREIARCQKHLEGRTKLFGVVLNRARAPRRGAPG